MGATPFQPGCEVRGMSCRVRLGQLHRNRRSEPVGLLPNCSTAQAEAATGSPPNTDMQHSPPLATPASQLV